MTATEKPTRQSIATAFGMFCKARTVQCNTPISDFLPICRSHRYLFNRTNNQTTCRVLITNFVVTTDRPFWNTFVPKDTITVSKKPPFSLSGGFFIQVFYLIENNRLVPQTLSSLVQFLKTSNASFITQELTSEIALTLAQIPRSTVPDMPDRIIAATALYLNLPLVTKDRKIQALTSIQTIW